MHPLHHLYHEQYDAGATGECVRKGGGEGGREGGREGGGRGGGKEGGREGGTEGEREGGTEGGREGVGREGEREEVHLSLDSKSANSSSSPPFITAKVKRNQSALYLP